MPRPPPTRRTRSPSRKSETAQASSHQPPREKMRRLRTPRRAEIIELPDHGQALDEAASGRANVFVSGLEGRVFSPSEPGRCEHSLVQSRSTTTAQEEQNDQAPTQSYEGEYDRVPRPLRRAWRYV